MRDAWQILRDGGLPLAAARSGPAPSAAELGGAVRDAIASKPLGREADALAAYVLAWQQHWPTAFATALGSDAGTAASWAIRHATDANRYLKLRRIALENLSCLI